MLGDPRTRRHSQRSRKRQYVVTLSKWWQLCVTWRLSTVVRYLCSADIVGAQPSGAGK